MENVPVTSLEDSGDSGSAGGEVGRSLQIECKMVVAMYQRRMR